MPKHLIAIEKVATLPDVSLYADGYPVRLSTDGLIYLASPNAATPGWEPAGSAAAPSPAFNDLTDVDLTGATEGQGVVLAGGIWVPGAVGGGGAAQGAYEGYVAPRQRGSHVDAVNFDWPRGLTVQGNYAFVGVYNTDTIAVLDIANPSAPTVVGTLTDATNLNGPSAPAVVGTRLYVVASAGGNVAVLNIADPTAPVLLGNSTTGNTNISGAEHILVDGDYAYICSQTSDVISIFNISDPTNMAFPTASSAANQAFDPVHMAKRPGEDYLFVASHGNNFDVFDVTNKTAGVGNGPPRVGRVVDSVAMLGAYASVQLYGDYALVVTSGGFGEDLISRLAVINIADPLTPTVVTSIALTGNARGICDLQGDYLYIPVGDLGEGHPTTGGVVVVDVSNPTTPVVVRQTTRIAGHAGLTQVIADGKYMYGTAYVADAFIAFG